MSESTPGDMKPVVYILHGDDEYEMNRFVDKLCAKMGDPSMAELNTSRLDGRTASLDDIRTACYAIPFLADRRLVIVIHPLARLTSPESQGEFRELLNNVPPSTTLVLLIEDVLERRAWKNFSEKNWLNVWAQKAGAKAYLQLFAQPQGGEMAAWIRKKAKELGGQFDPPAAAVLAGHIGSDTRAATLEIEKLLTYVDFKRPVMAEDVEMLTAPGGQVNIFDMTDALAAGNTSTALRLFHRLLDDQDAAAVFPLIIRLFRQLIIAREILDEGEDRQAIISELRVIPFVAEKLESQARRFTTSRLDMIYHRLLEIDEASKTSQSPLELSLDALIVELGG